MINKTIHKRILFYCFKYSKNAKSKKPKTVKNKNGETMSLSKCAVCNSKKLKCIKEQEAKGLLSKLTGIKVKILNDLSIANILF